jgi:hypothetical protein
MLLLARIKGKKEPISGIISLVSLVSRNKILWRGVQNRTRKEDFQWRMEFVGCVTSLRIQAELGGLGLRMARSLLRNNLSGS